MEPHVGSLTAAQRRLVVTLGYGVDFQVTEREEVLNNLCTRVLALKKNKKGWTIRGMEVSRERLRKEN